MTRATEALSVLAVLSVLYVAGWFGYIPLPKTVFEEILPVLPWWALVTFGSYSLGNIGFHVMTFGDCPEAYHELMGVRLTWL
ncbi:dolichol-phosphate mannosyltransferase subunit 3 [Jimgerdemannia flammicorona]|uniref:Dolichol-phosphate mannosyltransferase subunit 3 n=1 Tax=Jimgerdemannia flammicorona TaxID=994334 RepID=A0A433A118_9FUNG|nr:dolichol-phosphate mannosyltransferase subunit 3 [Jimgerdemannia flammicorona]